ncbi:MAG: SBBP repeat-containing protein [Chitinophagaceae bacterium]
MKHVLSLQVSKKAFFCLVWLLCFLSLSSSLSAQDLIYAKGFLSSSFTGTVTSRSIEADASGNTYVTGYFTGTVDFDPGAGSANKTSTGSQDIFIAKYDALSNYLFAKAIGSSGNDMGYDIGVDGAGHIFVTGSFTGIADFDPGAGVSNLISAGSQDIFVARYDVSGNYVYAKSMGGAGNDLSNGVSVDNSGDVYVSGAFTGTVDFDPGSGIENLTSANIQDMFIARYDVSGNYVYARNISAIGNGLTIDGNGNAYVTGQFSGTVDFDPGPGQANVTSVFGSDIFIARYDASGNYVYAYSIGGFASDRGTGIALDDSGNVYITGVFVGRMDVDPGSEITYLFGTFSEDIFIAKYSLSGNYIYAKALGGPTPDYPTGIVVDGLANVYVTGYFTGTADFDPGAGVTNLVSAGSDDIFVAKYDAAGDYVYAKQFGSPQSEIAYGIALDGLGNTHVTGIFRGTVDFDPGAGVANLTILGSGPDAFISGLNSQGNYKNAIQLGNYPVTNIDDLGKSIAVDALGNTYITGYFAGTADFDPGDSVANLTSKFSSRDIFIASYDASGNYRYAIAIGSINEEMANSIAVDGSGNVYVTGYFSGSVDFDPGAGESNLTSTGSIDIFLAKYDASGNYVFAKAIGSTGNDAGNGITITESGNVYITGYFSGTVDFDPGAGVTNLANAGSLDIFVVRYNAFGEFMDGISVGGPGVDMGNDLAVDGSGNMYVCGLFTGIADFDPGPGVANLTTSGMFVARYDASGNYGYAKSSSSSGFRSQYAFRIAVDGSGNANVIGSTNVGPGSITWDIIFVARYDASGNNVFTKTIGVFAEHCFAYGIDLDSSGNMLVTGSFTGRIDFDPGAGTAHLFSHGTSDIFIAKYDAAGNYLYAKGIGGVFFDGGHAIAVDGLGNVYVTGSFGDTVDFDPGNGTANLTAGYNYNDIFIAKYGPSGSLPVDLLSFSAKTISNGAAIQINWSTASETNNAYFEVERSKDGVHFEAIGRKPGCSSCAGLQRYELYDNSPYSGLSYYRLKQVDHDAKFSYSSTERVNILNRDITTVHVYPNITDGAYQVIIKNNSIRKQFMIRLLSAAGALIKQQQVWLNEGNSKLSYSLADQASGVYYISIVDKQGKAVSTLKIVKK